MRKLRKIIRIDEEKCDGCGLCVPACAEGALQIVDGKARLVKESYCDGLGACIGDCPRGAIGVEEREAEVFDAAAAEGNALAHEDAEDGGRASEPPHGDAGHACPGSHARDLRTSPRRTRPDAEHENGGESLLVNWPVQLALAPVKAPYFDDACLLIAADCTAFAFAAFHERFLDGRTVVVGCPKLDDSEFYERKLAQILLQNDVKELQVVYMEVPCCFGLAHLVQAALAESGKDLPLTLTKLGIKGDILEITRPKAIDSE